MAREAEWVRRKLGFKPDAMQSRVLEAHTRRGLLNCCRQWGKSTLGAAMAVHQAYTKPESLTLVISPSARQSGEFVRKAARFLEKLGVQPKAMAITKCRCCCRTARALSGCPATKSLCAGFQRSR